MPFDLNVLVVGFFIYEWALRIVMLFVVPKRRKPSSATAWLMLIMFAPTLGALIYLMFGNPKLPKIRREKLREVDRMTENELFELRKSHKDIFINTDVKNHSTQSRLATVLGGLPPMTGNKVEFIDDYDEAFKIMAREINKAKNYVHIEYFIAALDDSTKSVFDAIKNVSERGVSVRFLYDKVVSRNYAGNKEMRQFLKNLDVELIPTLPLSLIPGKNFTRPDLRNHRKIVVIDGETAFSGSQNLINKGYKKKNKFYYEEIVVKLNGPIVWQCNNVFRADWFSESGEPLLELVEDNDIPEPAGNVTVQVLPSSPSHDHENNVQFYTSMLHSARKRIGIVIPYFVPDEPFFDALISAAQRGVEVTMINSEVIDKILVGHAQRSYYEELLEVGVKIYLYDKPVFLHTKQVVIDDEVAIVGSSNLDIRSFELDLELDMIFYNKEVVKKLDKIESRYKKRTTQLTLAEWQKRSIKSKMLDSIARLTAALQ